MLDQPIGSVVQVGKQYCIIEETVESSCVGCYLDSNYLCPRNITNICKEIACMPNKRVDKKNAILTPIPSYISLFGKEYKTIEVVHAIDYLTPVEFPLHK